MSKYSKDKQELTPVEYNPSSIKIRRFTFAPNQMCFRLHWHGRLEFIYLRKGTMLCEYGTSKTHLRENELIFFPPKMPHTAYSAQEHVEYDVITFDIRSFYNDSIITKDLLSAIYEGRAKYKNIITNPEVLNTFHALYRKAADYSLEVIALVYQFLFLLNKYALLETHSKIHTDTDIREIIDYIENNFSQELTTATLSKQFGYSSAHFCYKFKVGTGLTPMNYLKIHRMEEAYKLLQRGERNISKVATLCGYSDANYFTRCFKSHFGVAPSKLKL